MARLGQVCAQPVNEIDNLLSTLTHHIPEVNETEEGFFIEWVIFEKIFNLFEASTLDLHGWSSEAKNDHWDVSRLSTYYQMIKKAYFESDDRLMLIVKRGCTLKQLKDDGRTPLSSPDTSKSDLKQMKELM